MFEWLIPLAIIAVAYFIYVRVIQVRNKAREAASSIDVQLQKRRNLVPNILKLAQKFMDHEKSLLQELTALRARTENVSFDQSTEEAIRLDDEIGKAMMHFFAVAENYPDRKSSEPIMNAQDTYSEVEGHISAARRFYNSAVTDLNNVIEIFPWSLVAQFTGVKAMPYFEAVEGARAPVDVDDYMK